jgi:seryl-tRNA synthetase
MSEKQPTQAHEKAASHEKDSAAAEMSRQNIERIRQLAEQEKQPDGTRVESLREQVEALATKTEDQPVATQENRRQPNFDQTELKKQSYEKTLKKVQSQLTPTQRALSKFMHNNKVETISEFGGKTIARPSGVLGGGLVAFFGSGTILYFARHYGYTYNYGVILLLYVVGFGIGVALELTVHKLSSRK